MSEAKRIAQVYREREGAVGSRYDPRNRGNRLVLEERRSLTRRLLAAAGWLPLGRRRVLDVGSGSGAELAWLLELGASPSRLLGIDLLPERVAAARSVHPQLDFRAGNAERLDFDDCSFDLVMAITLFSSILDASMAANVASEIHRVIKAGGGLLWYDFRYDNPGNRNVRGVPESRVRALFPHLDGNLHSLTVMPPLVRRLGPVTTPAYALLAAVPPLRSHLIGLLRKAS